MAIIVQSPFSGQPVKVRDQDAGRSVRDEEGRIFYVLPKSDGSGHYGAPTRAGGPKDEQRALELEQKVAATKAHAQRQQRPVHDATGGRGRARPGRWILLFVLLALGAGAYLFTLGPLRDLAPWATTQTQEPTP